MNRYKIVKGPMHWMVLDGVNPQFVLARTSERGLPWMQELVRLANLGTEYDDLLNEAVGLTPGMGDRDEVP